MCVGIYREGGNGFVAALSAARGVMRVRKRERERERAWMKKERVENNADQYDAYAREYLYMWVCISMSEREKVDLWFFLLIKSDSPALAGPV